MAADAVALLQARKDNILTAIANLDSLPDRQTGDGEVISRVANRKALMEELKMVNEALVQAEGPYEIRSRSVAG